MVSPAQIAWIESALTQDTKANPPVPRLTIAQRAELRALMDAGRIDEVLIEIEYYSKLAFGRVMEKTMQASRELSHRAMTARLQRMQLAGLKKLMAVDAYPQATPSPAPPIVADSAPGDVKAIQTGPQAAPAKVVAGEATVNKPPKRRRTWWSVASAYMIDVMRAGQYATAKQFFNELDKKAGPNSPFEKGTGNQRGSLFVREIGKPLALKTVQTNWLKLKEAAKK